MSIYVNQTVDVLGQILSTFSAPTSAILRSAHGTMVVRKRLNGGILGDNITCYVGVSIIRDESNVQKLYLNAFGLPSLTGPVTGITVGAGPPQAIQINYSDTDQLTVEFNEPNGTVTVLNSGLNTIEDVVIGFNVTELE